MAKITRSNYLDVVDNVWTAARKKGIMHINLDDQYDHGTALAINGNQLKNFGSCGYMGLENHADLIKGSIDLTKKYGVQLAISRAYVRPTYTLELEGLLSQIFGGRKTLVYSSTSNAHISIIATVIGSEDLVVLDQQVHFSVQFPARNMKLKGTILKIVKHADYVGLEKILQEETNNYNKIWYMADGVYSMHGDVPDMDILNGLMAKYPKLYCYFDDAHGMSWGGSNGSGYIFDKIKFPKRTYLMTTLGKSFGCIGGVAVFPDDETYRKVDVFGGPLSYSHPLPPPVIGAAIASAKIHLSPLMAVYQGELKQLMDYFQKRMREEGIPNLSTDGTPIYFIACGLNRVTRNLVKRILNDGFYVNTATFPVVANDKSGIRISLNRHLSIEDIEGLVKVIKYHFPLAMEEENDDFERMYNDFGLKYTGAFGYKKEKEYKYKTEIYKTISDVNKEDWDTIFKDKGNFDFEGLKSIESIFSQNDKATQNWEFRYVIIRDENNEIKLATHFTSGIYKDDMLSHEDVSIKIEKERLKNPNFLCSQTLAMGNMFSEGDLLNVNAKGNDKIEAIGCLFECIRDLKNEFEATTVILRDFEADFELAEQFEDEGYAKIRLPNSNLIKMNFWNDEKELLELIPTQKRRRNIRNYALKLEHLFEVEVKENITKEEADIYYRLFVNVKDRNYAFNFFKYPEKMPIVLAESKAYEFIEIRLKETQEIIAAVWSYKGEQHYSPMIMGLDYRYTQSIYLYKQTIYQIVKRANFLKKEKVYLGYSADFEKRRYGAEQIETYCYLKVDDTFNLDVLESISNLS